MSSPLCPGVCPGNDSTVTLPSPNTSWSPLSGFDEVVELAFVTGRFDLILTLDCESTETFTEFGMSQINPDKNIKHCWTLMQLRKLMG